MKKGFTLQSFTQENSSYVLSEMTDKSKKSVKFLN